MKPDSSVAQRSAASGKLVLVMPKEDPQQAVVDVAYLRPSGAADQAAGKPRPKTKDAAAPVVSLKAKPKVRGGWVRGLHINMVGNSMGTCCTECIAGCVPLQAWWQGAI